MQSHHTQTTPLSRAIMRRVYFIFILQRVFSPFGVKVMVATALAFVGSFLVSVPAILQNTLAHGTLVELVQYFLAALTGTSIIMKAIVLALGMCALLMAYDMVRMVNERKGVSILHKAS